MITELAPKIQVVPASSQRQFETVDEARLQNLYRRYRRGLADPDSPIPKAYALVQIAELQVEIAVRRGIHLGRGR